MSKKDFDYLRGQEVRRALRHVIEDILVDDLKLSGRLREDFGEDPAADQGVDPEAAQEAPVETDEVPEQGEELPTEPQPDPELSEPQIDLPPGEYTIIGDTRRLKAFSLSTNLLSDRSIVGEAWQDEHGVLFGTGIFHVMLFEPLYKKMYKEASIGLDASPLSILGMRASRSPFIKIEWSFDQHG